MKITKKEIRSKANPAVAGASGGSSLGEVASSIPNLNKVKNTNVYGSVEENALNSGIEAETEVLDNLLKRLEVINKPKAAMRLKVLYNIADAEDFDPERDELLKIDSAQDFVSFLENQYLDEDASISLNYAGLISTDWEISEDCFLGLDFLGDSKIAGTVLIKDKTHPINANFDNIKSKLTELKVI